jgi:hypothetical protein
VAGGDCAPARRRLAEATCARVGSRCVRRGFSRNPTWKRIIDLTRERRSAFQARRRARPRRSGTVRAVPASGAHAEVPECPAVLALRWCAPVHDVHGRWDGAKWRGHTSRRTASRAPLTAGATARRRALPPTPHVLRSSG